MSNERRLIVSGPIPKVRPGEFDVVDRLAAMLGMPCEDVVHVARGRNRVRDLNTLQGMRRYVAAVAARDVIELLPSATDVILLGSTHREGIRLTDAQQQLVEIIDNHGINTLVTSADKLQDACDRLRVEPSAT